MQYNKSVPFNGSASTAIETAQLQLMANGFKLDQPGETELIATGRGMHSTKQNPIVGASHVRITVSSSSINICAELGGVKFMQRFVYIFPPALGGFLALVFAFIPNFPKRVPLMALLPILPWLVISPLMARWIKNRTTKALNTLVHNMASVR